jgi:hypothetical protein
MKAMRARLFGGPEQLRFEDAPDPRCKRDRCRSGCGRRGSIPLISFGCLDASSRSRCPIFRGQT